jgi:hypothetical protein
MANPNSLERLFGNGPFKYSCIGEALAVGVLKGKFMLEAFDKPPASSFRPSDADYARYNLTPDPHCNVVRDWIEGNRERWDAMLRTAMALELLELEKLNPAATTNDFPHEEPPTRHCHPIATQGNGAQDNNSHNPRAGDGA